MKLVELSVKDGKDVYDMLQRIGYDENAFRNDVHGMSYDQYTSWLNVQHSWSKGELLPNGYVRQWTYWLKTDENIPVGYGKLREQVTEESRCFGGNLGFAIDPLWRGKGYGNCLFLLLLHKATEKKIIEVFSTVEKYNYASKKIHEKYGGYLVKEDMKRWYFSFELSDRFKEGDIINA